LLVFQFECANFVRQVAQTIPDLIDARFKQRERRSIDLRVSSLKIVGVR